MAWTRPSQIDRRLLVASSLVRAGISVEVYPYQLVSHTEKFEAPTGLLCADAYLVFFSSLALSTFICVWKENKNLELQAQTACCRLG